MPVKDRRLRPWLFCLLSVVYLLAAGEFVYRFVDGFQFTSLTLQPRQAAALVKSTEPSGFERKMLDTVTFDRSLDTRWFFAPAKWPPRPTPPEIDARTKARAFGGAENYVWNENYLRKGDYSLTELFNGLSLDDIFAFRGFDDSIYPRYKLLPGIQAGAGPANQFGYLYGNDLALKKAAKTIRVGWLGDSTSSQVDNFLDAYFRQWTERRGDGLQVEVINASRNASDLHDMASVLRHELGPFGIDYVISYSGNRMSIDQLPPHGVIKLPPGVQVQTGAFEYEEPSRLRKALAPYRDSKLAKTSALFRHGVLHLLRELPGSELPEPAKPAVEVVYTPAYNATAPNLVETRKIHYLGRKLMALDAFKAAARDLDITPIVSTEMVYIQPGMVPRHRPNRHLYGVANGSTYSPLTYTNIRKLLAGHNAIIATWARENDVAVIDTASLIPPLPVLSGDTVHDFELGIRMRAWIAFQTLLPMIERDLKSGRLPRPAPVIAAAPADLHPYLDRPPVRIKRTTLLAAYNEPKSAAGSPEPDPAAPIAGHSRMPVPLDKLTAIDPLTRVELGATAASAVIHLSTERQFYAAHMGLTSGEARTGPGAVTVTARALTGRTGVCLTAGDGKQIGVCQIVAPLEGKTEAWQTVRLLVPDLAEVAQVSFANVQPGQLTPSSIEIRAIDVWRKN
ncbi:MAG: hypothetical protein ACKVP7_17545 [Hyphomicrobiaceae bacterium]